MGFAVRLIDSYFYRPLWWQKIIIFLLLPLSYLYCLIATMKRKLAFGVDFGVPIISVGNLILGGSGKTPFIIEVSNLYRDRKIAIILRGYKRKSKGLVVVSQAGEILCSQEEAGDEAYLIACSVAHASVIVSKKRSEAILKAISMGCEIIFLDDGFRFNFCKLNLVLKPKLEPYYSFCIPSGMYRECRRAYKEADLVIEEGVDYEREVVVKNPSERMLLVTAIANPMRLDEFLPSVVGKVYYADHSRFDLERLRGEIEQNKATSLLVTSKDAVKLEGMDFPLSILQLRLKIAPEVLGAIDRYIQSSIQKGEKC